MYSGGYCVAGDPIIIEDGLSYTVSGNGINPDPCQLGYRQYSYRFGLYRYIDCDPEFNISGEIMLQTLDYIKGLSPEHQIKILDRVNDLNTYQERLIYYLHYLRSYYDIQLGKNGNDNTLTLSTEKSDQFFQLCSTDNETLNALIQTHQSFVDEIKEKYKPSL